MDRLKIILIIIGVLIVSEIQILALEESFRVLPKGVGTIKASPIITAIEIKGNINIGEDTIMDAVFSKVGDTLLEEKVKGDIKAIYALGYFSDVSASFESFAHGTKIIFIVSENPKLYRINIEGNTVYKKEKLQSLMKSRVSEMLNFKTLQDDIKNINNLYKEDGYMLARVVDVDVDEKTRALNLKIVEGSVESIVLEGNEVTQNYVILREMKTKPGMVLNEKVLGKDIRRVFNLGFFSEITPLFEPGSSGDKIVLVLKIKETRTSSINFGGGYGEREGWFGFIDLSINNLLGTGHGMLIRGQSGQQLTTYQFKYFYPWLLPDTLGERVSGTFRRWYTIGRDIYLTLQDEVHDGWDVSLGKPLGDEWSTSFSFGNEGVSPRYQGAFEAYHSSTLGLSISYDTRDFWLNPTEGAFYTFSTRYGWKYTSITTQFSKYGIDLNRFIKLAEGQTLAGHIGSGIGFGDVPIGELYWAGGATTVRGYYPSETKTGVKKFIFNLEYRYTFNEMFQGVLFYDWGYAWNVSIPSLADFMTGRGFGIRLNTPLGPIRLDYGIASTKSFGEGVTHFSIGHAF